jgi:6-phosphofructokinase 1
MGKRIGIMTTGGDCSGLNSVIRRLMAGGRARGHRLIGVLDGTDGLTAPGAPHAVDLTDAVLPIENARLSGSFLRNGNSAANTLNFESAKKTRQHDRFTARMKKSLNSLNLDALVLIGGNGSLSMANWTRTIYVRLQLIGIPKTIDMDIPLTDKTIGFDTAVQSLTAFCDQLMLTARSHHRWFIVQTMGRDVGALALSAGVSVGADAIITPEIKFKPENLAAHLKKIQLETGRDYGIIMVAEGVRVRGHSGPPAEIISRLLAKAGLNNRASFPSHIQRAGDTTAADRLLSARMADCALNAIDNNETNMMVVSQNGACKTVPLIDMIDAGEVMEDPNIPDMFVSNAFVPQDHPLYPVAVNSGVYIGETK